MRIGSLFSGAGGLDMAVEAVLGGEVIWQSEIDLAASKVLAHHWPEVPNLGDITQIGWDNVAPVDIICGGFPCQDLSAAGKRAGLAENTRSGLWSIFADAIDALRPPVVIIENVRGLLSAKAHRNMESTDTIVGEGTDGPVLRAAGAVLGDLSDIGYDAQWTTIAAADVGAPHRRERVFILATDTECGGWTPVIARALQQHWTSDDAAGSSSPTSDLVGSLLPTPRNTDGERGPSAEVGGYRPSGQPRQLDLNTVTARELLPTPAAADGQRGQDFARANRDGSGGDDLVTLTVKAHRDQQWGKYERSIRRWEQLTRPAPAPTEPNKNGNPRLSAAFSEWLMGWPDGWVTDPDIGISRNDQLRIVGNGVCPQQAIAALRYLLSVSEVAT